MTFLSPQEREEAEFGQGPVLWDATPGVCCAAYQLGACEHTESFDYEDEPVEREIPNYEEIPPFDDSVVVYNDDELERPWDEIRREILERLGRA